MNLELLTKQVANLSRAVGRYIKGELKNIRPDHSFIEEKVLDKGGNSFVTYVDRNSEQRLVRELGKLLPGAGFIAEENDNYPKGGEYTWVIDPLDGTTNYIHGVPVFSISIALMKNERTVSAVVYEINQQECFYAWEGGKSYLNGFEIHVSSMDKLNRSLLATGFPYHDYSMIDDYTELLKHFMLSTAGIRRMGSAAVDLAYVACGRFDAFFEHALNPWDVAAGSLIVEQAGGIVSDFRGTKNHISGKEIVASNPLVYEEFMAMIKKQLGK